MHLPTWHPTSSSVSSRCVRRRCRRVCPLSSPGSSIWIFDGLRRASVDVIYCRLRHYHSPSPLSRRARGPMDRGTDSVNAATHPCCVVCCAYLTGRGTVGAVVGRDRRRRHPVEIRVRCDVTVDHDCGAGSRLRRRPMSRSPR